MRDCNVKMPPLYVSHSRCLIRSDALEVRQHCPKLRGDVPLGKLPGHDLEDVLVDDGLIPEPPSPGVSVEPFAEVG